MSSRSKVVTMLPAMQPDGFSHMCTWMHHGSSSGQTSSRFTEDELGTPHPKFDELDGGATALDDSGATVELVGAASELVGSASELAGVASELLDSIREEIASATELLTGSWLRGKSTILLELLGVFSPWLELAGPSVGVELLGVVPSWLELLTVSDELTESGRMVSSGATSPPRGSSELADEVSSQAFSVNAAAMPSAAAMALLVAVESGLPSVIFFFSIFIYSPKH